MRYKTDLRLKSSKASRVLCHLFEIRMLFILCGDFSLLPSVVFNIYRLNHRRRISHFGILSFESFFAFWWILSLSKTLSYEKEELAVRQGQSYFPLSWDWKQFTARRHRRFENGDFSLFNFFVKIVVLIAFLRRRFVLFS